MYHAIVINKQFKDESYCRKLKVFDKKISGSWEIYGVEVEDSELEKFIQEVQLNTKENEPWYAHAYNDKELIVIFKENVFYVEPHQSTWGEILEYGRAIGIPKEQLDFCPNRFQDERHYFI